VKLALLRTSGKLIFWDALKGVAVFKDVLTRGLADEPDVALQTRRLLGVIAQHDGVDSKLRAVLGW
jgi:hypothetical protein